MARVLGLVFQNGWQPYFHPAVLASAGDGSHADAVRYARGARRRRGEFCPPRGGWRPRPASACSSTASSYEFSLPQPPGSSFKRSSRCDCAGRHAVPASEARRTLPGGCRTRASTVRLSVGAQQVRGASLRRGCSQDAPVRVRRLTNGAIGIRGRSSRSGRLYTHHVGAEHDPKWQRAPDPAPCVMREETEQYLSRANDRPRQAERDALPRRPRLDALETGGPHGRPAPSQVYS